LAAGAAGLPAVSRIARAQAYPTRPVRIIVGFPEGYGSDILARLVGQRLSERLGQQFVIENRPGAGSNIGTEVVVRAPPDGYTLLMIVSSNLTNATLYEQLNFNFIRDIAPVASIGGARFAMVVPKMCWQRRRDANHNQRGHYYRYARSCNRHSPNGPQPIRDAPAHSRQARRSALPRAVSRQCFRAICR
jgi:hypothetical protein